MCKDKLKSIAKRNRDRRRLVSNYCKLFFSFIDHNYYFEGVYDDEDEYLATDSIKDKYHYHPYPVYSILIKNNNTNSNKNSIIMVKH